MALAPLLIAGTLGNLISMTVGLALLMLVLWQSRQTTNLLYALFLTAMICVGFAGLAFRFSPLLNYDGVPWFYLLSSSIGAYGVTLFIFTSEFAGKGTRLARGFYVFGVILWVVTVIMMWNGLVATNILPTVDGRTRFDFTPLGYGLVAILISFELLALASLLIKSTPQSRALAPGVGILVIAAVLDLFPFFAHLPVHSMMTAIAAVIMGRQILKSQLFDPMHNINIELGKANKELAEANTLKSQFLANMSHELRTPLNSIIGYSELILDELYGPLTDKQRDRLQKVHRNGRNLLALINDILDLSKIEAGRMELDFALIPVQEVIEGVASTVQPMAQERGLDLRVDVPPDLPQINADRTRLTQIVLNLASNAVKFTPEGSVSLEAGVSTDHKCLEIRIRDTGIGIAPHLLDTIFDEFRQADNTTTREYGGTGLGLAISRRFARLHGGNVIVQSAPGQGSTFIVTLPLTEGEKTTSLPQGAAA